MDDIDIAFKYLETAESFKYLGSIANGDNSIEEEINKKLLSIIKLIMPIKKIYKQISMNKNQVDIVLDCNTNCDEICQRNIGTKGIYETQIINNWEKDIKKNLMFIGPCIIVIVEE